MKTRTDQSYGVIPYAKTVDGKRQYFLIHQYSAIGNDTFWTFPKGHPEAGERPEETAMRELQEETQLILESLNTTVTFDLQYTYLHEECEVQKQVGYFLGEAASAAYTLDGTEVKEAGWFSFVEASLRLTHPDTQSLLASVEEYLQLVDKK